jgi:hypothetical protein
MNIKVKAAIDVVVTFIGFVFVAVTVRSILEFFSKTYGVQNTIDGLVFGLAFVGLGFTATMLYRIRVSDLEYRAKLKEMVKK